MREKFRSFSVWLSTDTIDKLKAIAQQKERSVSFMVRKNIEALIEDF